MGKMNPIVAARPAIQSPVSLSLSPSLGLGLCKTEVGAAQQPQDTTIQASYHWQLRPKTALAPPLQLPERR
jgi:hypothetical protein